MQVAEPVAEILERLQLGVVRRGFEDLKIGRDGREQAHGRHGALLSRDRGRVSRDVDEVLGVPALRMVRPDAGVREVAILLVLADQTDDLPPGLLVELPERDLAHDRVPDVAPGRDG
jgi:hypothetical protein